MKTLPAGDYEDFFYVQRSKALQRGIIKYIKTPLFSEACSFFGREGLSAKVFAVLREPVSRLYSLFWYLKDSTWEKSYDARRKDETTDAFINKETHDWLVKMLSSPVPSQWKNPQPSGEPEDLQRDWSFQAARYVLFDRIVYGFMDDLEHSVGIIFGAFGWKWVPGDLDSMSKNVNERPKVATLIDENFRDKLSALNTRDVALYNEARMRYDKAKSETEGAIF